MFKNPLKTVIRENDNNMERGKLVNAVEEKYGHFSSSGLKSHRKTLIRRTLDNCVMIREINIREINGERFYSLPAVSLPERVASPPDSPNSYASASPISPQRLISRPIPRSPHSRSGISVNAGALRFGIKAVFTGRNYSAYSNVFPGKMNENYTYKIYCRVGGESNLKIKSENLEFVYVRKVLDSRNSDCIRFEFKLRKNSFSIGNGKFQLFLDNGSRTIELTTNHAILLTNEVCHSEREFWKKLYHRELPDDRISGGKRSSYDDRDRDDYSPSNKRRRI